MFSKSCEYGLRAVMYIAQQTSLKNKVSMSAISEEINSPPAFTAKILQQLTKNKLIRAVKGPYGGFFIEKEKLGTIMLSDVVNVLDGNNIYTGCGLGLKQCDANSPCPLHHKFVEIRNGLRTMLESTSLESLASEMNSDYRWLKR